jgi:hypothetical protein
MSLQDFGSMSDKTAYYELKEEEKMKKEKRKEGIRK